MNSINPSFSSSQTASIASQNPLRTQLNAILKTNDTNSQKTGALFGIAHELFSGCKRSFLESNSHQSALRVLFLSHLLENQVEPDLVAKAIEKAADQITSECMKETPTTNSPKLKPYSNSSEIVDISFGGGKRFIDSFLTGKTEGYADENNGRGVFFSVGDHTRLLSYATRSSILYFDRPATLKAKISANCLGFASRNGTEAILNVEHLKALTDKEVEEVSKEQFASAVSQNIPIDFFQNLEEIKSDLSPEEDDLLWLHYTLLKNYLDDKSRPSTAPIQDPDEQFLLIFQNTGEKA